MTVWLYREGEGAVTGEADAHWTEALFQLSLDLLCVADLDGYFLELNPSWQRSLGWSIEELKSKPYIDFVHPEDREMTREAMEDLRVGEDVISFENRYRVKGGGYRWLRWNAHADLDADRVYAAARDITEEKEVRQELGRRDRQLAEVERVGRVGYFQLDLRTETLGGSRVAQQIAGLEPGESIALSEYIERIHPEDRPRYEAALDRLRRGEGGRIDYRARDPDGETAWFTARAEPEIEDGEVVGARGTVQEITDRKRRERKLARIAAVVESSRDAILSVDRDLTIRTWNPTAEAMFGYEADEVVGEDLRSLTDDQTEAILDLVMAGEPVQGVDVPYHDGSGDERRMSVTAFPVEGPGGEVVGYSAICRDVTERHEREAELRFRTALLESTNEAAMDGILVVDPDKEIITYNERFAEMWEIPEEVLEARSDEVAIASVLDQLEDPDEFVSKIEHLYEHPEETSRDEIRLSDGRVFDRYSAPVIGDDGTHYGRVWFFRDVTERIEQADELLQLAGELKRSNEELERFAYVASHDLREPLRMVRGSVEELVEDHGDELPEAARELTGFAAEGAKRMERVIEDLLEYSRVDTRDLETVRVDPDEVVSEVLEDLSVSIEETGAKVDVGSIPPVVADRTQLRQVLQNLVSNAIRFQDEPPVRVSIDGRRDGDRIVVSVEDNGIGIDAADQGSIFGLFQRFGGNGDGTGIGLAICHKIVRRHGGEIWVDSTPGEGSTFAFTMPSAEGSDG